MDIINVHKRLQEFNIVNKEGRVVPFRPNAIQKHLLTNQTGRDIVVKPRQVGLTTLKLAEDYAFATMNYYTNVVLISHEREATRRLLGILKRIHEMLPAEDRPQVEDWNKDTITFPALGSSIYVGTAGARKFGRGDAIHVLHATEVAFWENAEENLTAVLQSVPTNGRICIESTPNGAAGKFWEMYMESYIGKSPYKYHFFPWWMQHEYAMPVAESFLPAEDEQAVMELHHLAPQQIMWRRFKQAEIGAKFFQEYPEDPLDCFLVTGGHVFDANVLREMMSQCKEPNICEDDGFGTTRIWDKPRTGMAYVIGADVAEGHKDGDYSAAAVLEHRTGRHVASLNGRWHPDEFAAKLDNVGRLYNKAYLAVETQGPGQTVLYYLDDILHYPNLHWTPDEHFQNWERGFKTTFITKPRMIMDLEEAIRHHACMTRDADLVKQFRNYRRVRLKIQDRYEAASGGHDDLLMAYAIALQVMAVAATSERAAPRVLV